MYRNMVVVINDFLDIIEDEFSLCIEIITFIQSDTNRFAVLLDADYGSGIMQITTLPTSSDIYYLQVLLNKDPDTQVATGTAPGAPGYETHSFGSATENAVKNFQTKYGISPVSGAVGYYTLAQLNALLPTSSIPSAFVFHEAMSTSSPFDSDRLSPGPENLGIASGISIPPCGELNHIGSST